MDAQGRIRPSKTKEKKKNVKRDNFDAVEELFKKIKFCSKAPKNINLTSEIKMPEGLEEHYR